MQRLHLVSFRPAASSSPSRTHLCSSFQSGYQITQQLRCASHATQGVANKAKQGPGKRLGAKKGDSELVVPGNIIFRQRGSLWHPGENCVMGRDHTISSLIKGYVRFYRDPTLHKTRKYIGVVFERNDTLPRQPGAPRRRRLDMYARVFENDESLNHDVDITAQIRQAIRYGVSGKPRVSRKPDTAIREGYQVRETNRSIGRTAEREGIIRTWRTDPNKERRVAWQIAEDQRRKAEGEKVYRRQKSRRYTKQR